MSSDDNTIKDGLELKGEYEITYLLRSDDALALKNILTRFKADLIREKPPVKVNLEYPIKKERQAFLGVVVFSADKSSIVPISGELKLNEDVLRFLITKFLPKVESEREIMGDAREGGAPAQSVVDERKKRRVQDRSDFTVLTNEALEKKIEEILQ